MAGIMDTSLSPPASGTAESIANEAQELKENGTHSFLMLIYRFHPLLSVFSVAQIPLSPVLAAALPLRGS